MKILIVDDHAVVRRGLRQILADEFQRADFGEARNAQEDLARVRKEKWDVVVLDITMPGRSGLEVLRGIKNAKAKVPVLVLSMHPEDQFAMRVLTSGKTVREIAEENFLSVKTVRTYRQRILEKMGLKRNAEVIRYALEHQLVK